MIGNKRVTSIPSLQMKHVKTYIRRKYGADLDWRPMKEIIYDFLKGMMRVNQVLHLSHACCICYS